MEINREEYLIIKGLFYMAKRKVVEAYEFETAMNNLANCEEGSHLSDLLYDCDTTTEEEFDEALRKEDITVVNENV